MFRLRQPGAATSAICPAYPAAATLTSGRAKCGVGRAGLHSRSIPWSRLSASGRSRRRSPRHARRRRRRPRIRSASPPARGRSGAAGRKKRLGCRRNPPRPFRRRATRRSTASGWATCGISRTRPARQGGTRWSRPYAMSRTRCRSCGSRPTAPAESPARSRGR